MVAIMGAVAVNAWHLEATLAGDNSPAASESTYRKIELHLQFVFQCPSQFFKYLASPRSVASRARREARSVA
jgi:hypothetical protein